MQALSIGISKRALLEDYYPGELNVLIDEYIILQGAGEIVTDQTADPFSFFGGGGEEIK
jgi:hypothetical protein